MSSHGSSPCALYGNRSGCRADTLGERLCAFCRWEHPAVMRPWRRANPGFEELFTETDKFSEMPFTCVVRRKRYVDDEDSKMVADVLEAWTNSGKLIYPKNPYVFWCGETDKEDTICWGCRDFLNEDARGKYFMKDGTVKEEYRKTAEDTATLSQQSSSTTEATGDGRQ